MYYKTKAEQLQNVSSPGQNDYLKAKEKVIKLKRGCTEKWMNVVYFFFCVNWLQKWVFPLSVCILLEVNDKTGVLKTEAKNKNILKIWVL